MEHPIVNQLSVGTSGNLIGHQIHKTVQSSDTVAGPWPLTRQDSMHSIYVVVRMGLLEYLQSTALVDLLLYFLLILFHPHCADIQYQWFANVSIGLHKLYQDLRQTLLLAANTLHLRYQSKLFFCPQPGRDLGDLRAPRESRSQPAVVENNISITDVLSDEQLATQRMAQASKMQNEARVLLAEADRLQKEAATLTGATTTNGITKPKKAKVQKT